MKQGKTLSQLAAEIERQENSKRDFVADTRRLSLEHFKANDGGDVLGLHIEGQAHVHINQNAHNQIAQRAAIPAAYYQRMLSEAPELLVTNVNHWWHTRPEARMVRTMDGTARAFLSDRYRPLDNFDLLEAILPVLQEVPDLEVGSCEITDSRLYLKALFPRTAMEVKPGDEVQAGIVISNSEIGGGSLRVEPMVYRLICTNGMIGATAMKKYHVGRSLADTDAGAVELYRDETVAATDRAFWMQAQDIVRASFDDLAFRRLVGSMAEAFDVKITADPVEVVERTAKRFGLNDGERGGILRHLIEGGDLSKYGLLNAVTRTSQDLDSYDRATEFERLGGTILELPANDWQRLAA